MTALLSSKRVVGGSLLSPYESDTVPASDIHAGSTAPGNPTARRGCSRPARPPAPVPSPPPGPPPPPPPAASATSPGAKAEKSLLCPRVSPVPVSPPSRCRPRLPPPPAPPGRRRHRRQPLKARGGGACPPLPPSHPFPSLASPRCLYIAASARASRESALYLQETEKPK